MDQYEKERECLMKKLLDSVKQCQVDFGGKTLLASEKDSSVSCLLSQFEQALQHALKRNKVLEKISSIVQPLRQMTEKMLPEIDITFWSVVKESLGTLEVSHFSTLEAITTDSGKARAWLRTALNEGTLERQLHVILSNQLLLRQFYEPWALVLDGERSSTMPPMARGLTSILFAINIKSTDLNLPFKQNPPPNAKTHRRIKSSPLPLIQAFDTEPSIMKKIAIKKKKKRKVVNAQIGNLDDNFQDDLSSLSESTETTIDDVQQEVMSAPSSPIVDGCTETHSTHSSLFDGSDSHQLTKEGNTTLDNSETSESSLQDNPGAHDLPYSHDMELFIPYDDESSQAVSDALALLHTDAQTDHPIDERQNEQRLKNFERFVPKPSLEKAMEQPGQLSVVELKRALLLVAKVKEETELRNQVLEKAVEEERNSNLLLREQYETLGDEVKKGEISNKKKLVELKRENDVLKTQLKKYVAAVQMLRKNSVLTTEDNQVISNLRTTPDDDDITIPPRPGRTVSENNSIFEERLAQMAEMHGELIELQEVLQRHLVNRDNQIARMKQELVSMRGPLPDDLEDSSSVKFNSSENLSSGSRLISIWIPSVFLKGKGSDAFHLYQIYIRIADDEWNVYRRYSQFNKLHVQMCKLYPVLEQFSFPKKKMFGKKDIKFVERRRKRLQEYLRILINTCISHQLTINISKQHLVEKLPFFSESFREDALKNKKPELPQHPQYTGL